MRARALWRFLAMLGVALFGLTLGPRASGEEDPLTDVYGPFHLRLASAGGEARQDAAVEEAERVSRELIRTNRLIAATEPKVNRSRNDKAKDDLAAAVARQVEARTALGESQFARAMRLTLEARAFAKSAGIKVGPAEEDPEAVARALEQTDDALARAKDVLQDAADQRTKARFEALRNDQKKARDRLKAGETRRAYGETRRVRDGVLKLLRESTDLPVPEATAKQALRRAEGAVKKAEDDLGEHPSAEAKRLHREALAQLQKARVALARKEYRDTLLYSKLVERKLELALDAQRVAISRSG